MLSTIQLQVENDAFSTEQIYDLLCSRYFDFLLLDYFTMRPSIYSSFTRICLFCDFWNMFANVENNVKQRRSWKPECFDWCEQAVKYEFLEK